MELTAIFESWHIGDGNYPPLDRGQLVRLSFELEPDGDPTATSEVEIRFTHLGNAQYEGVGRVVGHWSRLTVLEVATGFYLYIATLTRDFDPGAYVEFRGTLALDHFAWVENRRRFEGCPDLLVNLRVVRIRQIGVPEHFVARTTQGKAHPTRVGSSEFGSSIVLDSMRNQPFDEEFYVIDFDGNGLAAEDIPLTFQ